MTTETNPALPRQLSRALDAALADDAMPAEVGAIGVERWQKFADHHGDDCDWLYSALDRQDFARDLLKLWSTSKFVFESCLDKPEMLRNLTATGDLDNHYDECGYINRLGERLEAVQDESGLHRVLRQFRRREMVRIVWRDFSRQASLLDTTGDVTRLAEACIQQALNFLYPLVEATMGTPIGKYSGTRQDMVVLGMGKMGAWELNVSSDIDLIFAFPEAGETEGARKAFSNQEFFIRLSQKLIQALDNTTVDGFVFRVDMRLRPYGESGALVLNFDAMEDYYQNQGRDWERYAMIKARAVYGEPKKIDELMTILRPFTYRKYIDFSAIQALRDMKTLINREVARLGILDDVKKSAGGIREIEFVAQAFQLIRGGKDKRFQNPSLKHILQVLADERLLPEGEPENLWQGYEFLRNAEHVLQGIADKQTQRLPDDEVGRAVVAYLMGFAAWADFYGALNTHRARVKELFQGVAAPAPQEQQEVVTCSAATLLWRDAADGAELELGLEGLGFADAGSLASRLIALRESRAVAGMTATVRERLDRFIPLFLECCTAVENGADTAEAILPLIEGILRRSAYLVLMIENPDALRQLVYLCSESRWIAEQIGQYPALLDELLDTRNLFTPLDKEAIAQDLRQQLLRIPEEDLEAQMEVLRYFRRAHALRIAACEVEGALPLMKVSDNLTWLAEVIVEQVLNMAWQWMTERHGRPGVGSNGQEPGLLVIGYGKMGGIELGHGSDLDLVFLHNAESSKYSDGERSLDNNSYFARLCQRMIHILSTRTLGGDLYEIDTRLRPNGNSGLLVTSLVAFEKYQRENAWTWEHQALVRARAVAGDTRLTAGFDQIRHQILTVERSGETLVKDVIEMRQKMRSHLGSKGSSDDFHLKQDAGGIVDIEFIVQYLVLKHAAGFPVLTTYSDNMRLLETIADCGLLSGSLVDALKEAYIFYRSLGHRLNLKGLSNLVAPGEVAPHRETVIAAWQQVFPATSD